MRLGCVKGHHKITAREKVGVVLGYRSFLKFWGSPLIFLQRLKLATSNLVYCLGLPRPIIKLHPEEKWAWPWARGASQILGSPLIFLQRLKLATSNLVCSLSLQSPIIKSQPEKKWAWPCARGASQIWGFPSNISATTEDSDFKIGRLVRFAKAHHKIPRRRKKGVALSYGSSQKFGFP